MTDLAINRCLVRSTVDQVQCVLHLKHVGHCRFDEPLQTPVITADMVNHPPHYRVHPSGVECITITEHMGFNIGNAVKYLWRADEKGSALEDLKKAAWYVQREIERRST